MASSHSLPSTSELIGKPVKNARGDEIGRVEELRIDVPRGRIACVALSFGGFLGVEDRWFGVPWQALKFDRGADCFVLDVDRTSIEHAPGFNKIEGPPDDNEWLRGIYIYYGHAPYWEQG